MVCVCVCVFVGVWVCVCARARSKEIVTVALLFLSEGACQYLRTVSTLRLVSSRVHEIHVRYINIHSMKLSRELGCADRYETIIGRLLYNEGVQHRSF